MNASLCLISFTVVVGCGFGDNQRLIDQPDSGVSTRPDSGVVQNTPDASPDAAVINSCTLLPQSGCSGSTPACDMGEDGATYCRAVTQQGTSNSHCASDTECKAGYTCIGDTTTNPDWCARFCDVDADCTGTGSRCLIELSSSTTTMPLDVTVCTNACDPYAQTGCPSGMACLPYHDAGGNFTDCEYDLGKTLGQSCTYSYECAEGSLCVSVNGVKSCRATCIVGNSSTCAAGSCLGFATPLTIGTVTYGACN